MATLREVREDIRKAGDGTRADIHQKFFKTGKGQYGEGDIFLGLKSADMNAVAKKHCNLSLEKTAKLLQSPIHEHRVVALKILTNQFHKDTNKQKEIFNIYLSNTRYINNWDLVDMSAHKIVGAYLQDQPKNILYKLAKSNDLWERRISMIATFWYIRQNNFNESIKIANILVNDKHDLIHKAVGWMLREIGKRDQSVEEKFLDKHYKTMPRTMLRYAIERFEDKKRKHYMGR